MADQNSYLRYKRDTRHLLYWMIHTSNSIIKSLSSPPVSDSVPIVVNTTGQIPVSALVPVSKLIAKHINPVPSTIYSLFQSVIAARTVTHEIFQQIIARKPDPEIEKSNLSHKRFIDTLTEAFHALGGETWRSSQKSNAASRDEEDLDEVIFANKFAALGLDGSHDEDENDAEDAARERATGAAPKQKKKKFTRKGKKGKRGKKVRYESKAAAEETSLDDVPLESYRIIDDENGIVTDYLVAVYLLVQQWIELRHYVQGLWRDVSYGGLNSAVAGSLSNVAIAMVKQTESAIFVDFPGHESYETVMKTITRGDPEKAKGMFHMTLHRMEASSGVVEVVQETDIDVEEQFLCHAYNNLLDFITDFQKNRSGKPTKPIMSEIRDWDPHFDLQRANNAQRIKWRRAYSINWLYDLVNLFSAIVVQRNTMKGQNWKYETVDWSTKGPWNQHRRLFGLNEFAGVITSLAMQKPGTNIRQKILPHHVFQLQCIVDSLTVSRGWSLNSLKGHILSPPARAFHPRRDVDLFLDRENQRIGHGYCHAVDVLTQFFEKDSMMHGNPNRNEDVSVMLMEIRDDFVDWLGESKYMSGLTNIPPSRFSNTNANGLWEYSPFLCGVGLMEALELAYGMNFLTWDRMPEPMCLIHLHNMLVQKGFIKNEIGLYASLQQLFQAAFFDNGKVPTSDFSEAFLAVCVKTGSRRTAFERQAIRRTISRTAGDIHGLLNPKANRFFKENSLLGLYREADWMPERIPDGDVPVLSALCMMRIWQTKIVTDLETGQKVFDNTELVSRARALGIGDKMLAEMSSQLQGLGKDQKDQNLPEALSASLPEGHKNMSFSELKRGGSKSIFSGRELLDILKLDLVNDISGQQRPISALNYVWVTARFMMLFDQIESKLKRLRNPLWIRAYEQDPLMMRDKRSSLTALVLAEQDKECMEVMAREFQNQRTGFMTHIYWEDLDSDAIKRSVDKMKDVEVGGECTVM